MAELFNQMRKRFYVNEYCFIVKFKVLAPKVDQDISFSPSSIIILNIHFPLLVLEEKCDYQWRSNCFTVDKSASRWLKCWCICICRSHQSVALLLGLRGNTVFILFTLFIFIFCYWCKINSLVLVDLFDQKV